VLRVCLRDQLPPGDVRVVIGEVPIAVFCTDDDELYAIDDTCTHQATSLADGWVEGHLVECPLHESCFDLRTGAVVGPPAKLPVRTHQVLVEDGVVYVVEAG
jgi:3-phenylpropionate/trans-cinnamate dioxygenase ferredoxin subunit